MKTHLSLIKICISLLLILGSTPKLLTQKAAKANKLGSQEVSIKKKQVIYKDKKRKARVVSVKSSFDYDINFFFKEEMKISNTLEITKPMAKIRILGENKHEVWQEDSTYQLRILSFGLFPLGGTHFIFIEEINEEQQYIQTREHNKMAKIWDHRLIFEGKDKQLTTYEDNVTIYAGWMTPIFARYLVIFYKMRHRKWNKLLFNKSI